MAVNTDDRYGIIRRNRGGSGNTPPPSRTPSNSFNGWYIVLFLIILFLAYEVISNLSKKNSNTSSNQVTSQSNNNQYTPSENNYPSSNSTDTSISFSNENANPYGVGNGKITFYKICDYCPDLELSLDGNYIGTLTKSFDSNSSPSCDEDGTVSKITTSGYHDLTGKDSYGSPYSLRIYVTERECTSQKIIKENDVKPNQYGNGNGQLTIYDTCSYCTNVKVYADDKYLGTFTQYYKDYNSPSCGDENGAIIKAILSSGNHKITASDDNGNTWFGYATVQEGECKTYQPENFKKYSPYGEGNGQVTIYHNCNNCNNVQVYIDDNNYAGNLKSYFYNYSSPNCGTNNYGSISKDLSSGNHKITAIDDKGDKWSGYVFVKESQCTIYALENFKQTNPYGEGNGEISFWTNNNIIYDIYIDGNLQGSLNSRFANGIPACGQNGTFSIILNEGSHSFYAYNGRGGWKGSFTIIAGRCQTLRVNSY